MHGGLLNSLLFGKFAPVHLGHLYLIQTALEHSGKEDHVYVLVSENPEIDIVPAVQRAKWIQEAIADSRLHIIPTGVFPPSGRSKEAQKANFEYMVQHPPLGICIHRVYCNEWYGEHIAKDFGAQWIQVDPQRTRFPISASRIRNNPVVFASFLPHSVKDDFLQMVLGNDSEETKS